jgi:DNA-binding transcriptional regulator YiaG
MLSDMRASQFRAAEEHFGLEKQEFASLLGVDARTARRWSTGDRAIPKPIARLITMLLNSKMSGQELADLFKREKV